MEEPNAKRPKVILKKGKPALAGNSNSGTAPAGAGGSGAGGTSPGVAVARSLPPPPPAPKVLDSGPMATLDVGGQIFKISASLLRSKPGTLLAQLIDNTSGNDETRSTPPNGGRPIFVDAAPERFTCILDWYRYGEIHVPRSVPIAAVLQDARRLQLPQDIVINGVARSTGPNLAQKVGRDLMDGVVRRWPGFSAYFAKMLDSIREHFQAVGEASGPKPGTAGHQRPPRTMAADAEGAAGAGGKEEGEEEEAYDFPPFVLPLYEETGWLDRQHVCSAPRARALALRIEERGYRCDFTESELLVSLPLRLKGESTEGPYGEEDEGDFPFEEEEEGVAAPEHAGA